jgi:hypothetical protein
MAKMIRAIPEPSEEGKAENAERVRILEDLDDPSDDVDTKKQKYIKSFKENNSLRPEIERRIRELIEVFKDEKCTITQAEHDMHILVLNHMIDEGNRIITDIRGRNALLPHRTRTTAKSIRQIVRDYGKESAKEKLEKLNKVLNEYLLQQEKLFKKAYVTNHWKSVRVAIEEAVLESEHDSQSDPEKLLYRRLKKWTKVSQLTAIREKFWLEIFPGDEDKHKLLFDTFSKPYMVHLHDEMQQYAATQIHHHEPLQDSRYVKHSEIAKLYRELQHNFDFQRDEAIEPLKLQLRRSWNTDAQRIAAVRGLWREMDWQPMRNWLYDYIVDPLKSDDKCLFRSEGSVCG